MLKWSRKKFNPWVIEKSFTQKIGSEPATIRSNNESKIALKSQTKKKAKSSNYRVTICSTFSRKDRSWNIRSRRHQPKKRPDPHPRLQNLGYWKIRHWNKERVQPLGCARNNLDKNRKHCFYSTPTDLKKKKPPRFIEFPGKQVKTKVYQYYERPMTCKTCLRYGHTVKIYRKTIAACARCSSEGHNKDECTSTEIRCWYCRADYQAFSSDCPIFKRETEII